MSRFLLVAVLALAGCSKSESPSQPPPSPGTAAPAAPASRDPAAARALIAEGAVVIDVRTPDEYAGGHVATASNLPVQDLAQRLADVERLVGGDKSKPVVLYCGSGKRAGQAKLELEAAGYTRVVNGGGLDDLQ